MLPRHTLAWIDAIAGRRLVARAGPEARLALQRWLANGWPLCVRRPDIDEATAECTIALGLPLPPDQGKRRLKFVVDRAEIARTAEPLPLQAIVARAPARYRAFLGTLATRAHARTVPLRVYGSFAWQALTSWNYVTAGSDLDLLAAPSDTDALDAAIALLSRAEAAAPARLDGEIVFPGGDAVSWREWRDADPDAQVIVKRVDGVALTSREALRARLGAGVPA